MKKIILFLLAAFPLLYSCNDRSGSSADSTSTTDGHEHAYRCPMNCEKGKTYDKPGKCPVCGMNLEHYDGGEDNGLTYKMEFVSDPGQLASGADALLRFTPRVVGSDSESVALDLQHEKKIHLIVVSEDLSYFEHIHPDFQSDGSYRIKVLGTGKKYSDGTGHNETRFENGGNYFLFADYKPTGGSHQVEKIPVRVNGSAKPAVTYSADKLSGQSGKYSVMLTPTEGKLASGQQTHIAGTVMKDGKEVDPSTLENYLGAKAHMVVISVNEKEYLHVHPDVSGGKFDLHTTFKMPGLYRGWIQFKAEGKVHTIDVTMNVATGTGTAAQAGDGHQTKEDHSGH